MNRRTSFARDFIHSVIAAIVMLILSLVGLACLVLAGGIAWLIVGWLADFIAGTGDLARAALALGAMALLWLVFAERERGR